MKDKFLIVGLDPGTTFAFCAFDLQGSFAGVWSKRDAGLEEAIRQIRASGTPAIFTTDKQRVPDAVAKIAAQFNTRVWAPGRDMGEEEKRNLTSKYRFTNTHEADAAASALKAYHSVENKLRQVERIIREKGFGKNLAYAKYLVLGGMKLGEVLELIEAESRPVEPAVDAKLQEKSGQALPKIFEERLGAKDARIRELIIANTELRKRVETVERKRLELELDLEITRKSAYKDIRLNDEIRKRDMTITRLKQILEAGRKRAQEKREQRRAIVRAAENRGVDLEWIVSEYKVKRRITNND